MATSNSGCFYAAVTGQALASSKDYYDLICSPNVPSVLVQLALFTSHSSRRTAGCAANEQQQQQQQQAVASSAAAALNTATAGPTAAAGALPSALNGHVSRSHDAAAAHGLRQLMMPLVQGHAAQEQQRGHSCSTAQPSAAAAAAAAVALASKAQTIVGAASADTPGERLATAPPTAVTAQALPPLTASLLQFNVWATNDSPAAGGASSSSGCAQATAAAAVYREPGWLQDLQLLLPCAQQHL